MTVEEVSQRTGFQVAYVQRYSADWLRLRDYHPKRSERSHPSITRPVKPGSLASLYQSLDHVRTLYNELNQDMRNNKHDQDRWTRDEHESTACALHHLENLIVSVETSQTQARKNTVDTTRCRG